MTSDKATRTTNHCSLRHLVLSVQVVGAKALQQINVWTMSEDSRTRLGHFDSALMVEMAESCSGILAHRPDVDLLEGLSAHDLN